MSYANEGGMAYSMPVAPAYGGGFGGFGGDGAWWIIILLLCGWGGMGGFGGSFGGGYDFPWLLNGQQAINNNVSSGFRDAQLSDGLTSIGDKVSSGFGDLQTALCGGFAGVNASITNASMANLQSFNALQSQLAQCCCDNRLATCQTQNLVSSEGAATRAAIQAQTQAILDKMCEQEIEALKAANSSLQTQVLMRDLAASQTAQTKDLIADNTAQTQYIVNRVAPYPIPSYTVANPNTPAVI